MAAPQKESKYVFAYEFYALVVLLLQHIIWLIIRFRSHTRIREWRLGSASSLPACLLVFLKPAILELWTRRSYCSLGVHGRLSQDQGFPFRVVSGENLSGASRNTQVHALLMASSG